MNTIANKAISHQGNRFPFTTTAVAGVGLAAGAGVDAGAGGTVT